MMGTLWLRRANSEQAVLQQEDEEYPEDQSVAHELPSPRETRRRNAGGKAATRFP